MSLSAAFDTLVAEYRLTTPTTASALAVRKSVQSKLSRGIPKKRA
jgi:hypothetical protein